MPESIDQPESEAHDPSLCCPATTDGARRGVSEHLPRVETLLAVTRLPDGLRTRIRRKLLVITESVGAKPSLFAGPDAAVTPKFLGNVPTSFSDAKTAWSHLVWSDQRTDVPPSSEPIRAETSIRAASVLAGMLRWAMTRTEMAAVLDALEWWASRCRPTTDRQTRRLLAAEVLAALGSASASEVDRLLSAFETIRPAPRLAVHLRMANVNLTHARHQLLRAVGYPGEVLRDVL